MVQDRYPGDLGSHTIKDVKCPFCKTHRWRIRYAVEKDGRIRRFILVCVEKKCQAVAVGEILRGGRISCYVPIRHPEGV